MARIKTAPASSIETIATADEIARTADNASLDDGALKVVALDGLGTPSSSGELHVIDLAAPATDSVAVTSAAHCELPAPW